MIYTTIPYPGLRPFERGESDIFFGREEQTDQLLRRLEHRRFLAVVGSSGCGKSSLVRAGLLAALETGYMAQAGARWRVAVMRPGANPMRNLSGALLDRAALGPEREGHGNAIEFLEATLRRGPLGIVEALRETPLPPGTNLLLVVDQFEEIFRFLSEHQHDEADAFVGLLLESAAQRDFPVYVVLTMRSDYIGDCAVFTGLPEALNEGQYLAPRLSREQRACAITGPARVFGGDVEPKLVNQILNEMGPQPGHLPVLQHLLMRMWTYDHRAEASVAQPSDGGNAVAEKAEDRSSLSTMAATAARSASVVLEVEPANTAPRRVLTRADYDAVGGFANALSQHANQVFDSLSARQQELAAVMFRRLCHRGARGRDVRRPAPVKEIAAVGHSTISEVVAVADVFRSEDNRFLMPPSAEPLTADTMLDITHESLINGWNRLREWSEQEAQSAREYRYLQESAALWKEGKAGLWRTPSLENGLEWMEREKPTAEWAQRYGGNFGLAVEFLEASKKEHTAEQSRTEAQHKHDRQRKWLWRGLAALALVSSAIVLAVVYYIYGFQRSYAADYSAYTYVRGVPQGVGKQLTESQVSQRALSYRIISQGRYGPVTEMLSIGPDGAPTHFPGLDAYLEQTIFATQPRERAGLPALLVACDHKFIYPENGSLAYEEVLNSNHKIIQGIIYSEEKDINSRKAHSAYPDGFFPLPGSLVSIVILHYTSDGYEQQKGYFDFMGQPASGFHKVFGVKQEFDRQGRVTQQTYLDAGGQQAMENDEGVAQRRTYYDDDRNVVTTTLSDSNGKPATVNQPGPFGHWSSLEQTYDKQNGNEIARSYFKENHELIARLTINYEGGSYPRKIEFFDGQGNPVSLGGYHEVDLTFDDQGNLAEEDFRSTKGELISGTSGAAIEQLHYSDGNVSEIDYLDAHKQGAATMEGYSKIVFGWDEKGNETKESFSGPDGSLKKTAGGYARINHKYDAFARPIEESYFGEDGKPIRNTEGYAKLTRKYERRNLAEESYYDENGRPVLNSMGYAHFSVHYEPNGPIEKEFFGIRREPVDCKGGYQKVRRTFDAHNQLISAAYWDRANHPVDPTPQAIAQCEAPQ
jgi:hypothetical protein